jgi:hypothetical protein
MQSAGKNVSTISEPLALLLDLDRRARRAADHIDLQFLAVNDTRALAEYRQAALWFRDGGVKALSGVVQIEANAPYAQWLHRACLALGSNDAAQQARAVSADDLPELEADEWAQWLPAHGLWLPLAAGRGDDAPGPGALLLARDGAWTPYEIALLTEWADIWRHAWHARFRPRPWDPKRLWATLRVTLRWRDDLPWWKQRSAKWGGVVLALLLMPVRLTVLGQGELVPTNPAVIRAPLDGVIGNFFIKPNDAVKAGQPLFNFDDAPLTSRVTVASQTLATAMAEYRQAAQLAVSESKSKAQLATLQGKIEERRAEVDYLRGQLERAHVVAPLDGIALFDDPVEWIGKPVVTGERIMRIAAPDDMEVEAWLPLGDAIPLDPGASVTLYLYSTPLSPVSAKVRYVSYESVQRPDGGYAYRVRATLEDKIDHRVGLKGTAKLNGGWVPVIYWMLRRPIAVIRQTLGW